MTRFLLITSFAILILASGFVIAVEHPATRGETRCWIQETFYGQHWEEPPEGTPIVEASLVTDPVRDPCDAADDPAIWVTPSKLWVLGTNKQRSLNVYDERGKLASRADELGAPNNVDIREWRGRVVAMASDKDGSHIEGFAFDPLNGELKKLPGAPFAAKVEEEVYGLCLYQTNQGLFVFTTDKSGLIAQYRISQNGTALKSQKVRELRVASQPEGCVVDDAAGRLYVGEEDIGIWRFEAAPDASPVGELITKTQPNGPLRADVEGLTIYEGDNVKEGYLIASSQGDNSFAVFDRSPPHRFRGRFQVRHNGEIIGDTDGIAVTSTPIAPDFLAGLLVIQDGFIQDSNGKRRNQRFAYVSWSSVESALNLGTR